jgi:hypothetical protein
MLVIHQIQFDELLGVGGRRIREQGVARGSRKSQEAKPNN